MFENMKGRDKAPMQRVLVVDDERDIADVMKRLLEISGYPVTVAHSVKEALEAIERELPSVVVSDVNMPNGDGYELCREIRKRYVSQIVPIILVTGRDPMGERIKGLEAGADDFLAKPINKSELLARMQSLIRIRELHDNVQHKVDELAEHEKQLEEQLSDQQVKLGQLKRFFSPQVAEFIVSNTPEGLLKSHRKEVTVVFIDLRGFTSFAELAEPEEVMEVLEEYYAAAGNEAIRYEATIGRLAGDGMMFFFNDPVEIEKHEERALAMSVAIRDRLTELRAKWVPKGYNLDFGIGVASGHATIGTIGFEKFWDYSVIGTVTNLASRLCDEAKGGQILASERFLGAVGDKVETQLVGQLQLKGFTRPVKAFNIMAIKRA